MNYSRSAMTAGLFPALIGLSMVAYIQSSGGQALQGPGVTEGDLQALIFADTIPGFRQVPAVKGKDGPFVELDIVGQDGSSVSRVTGRWHSQDPRVSLDITVGVCDSRSTAVRAAKVHTGGAALKVPMPPGSRIGDASWMSVYAPAGFRVFYLGRSYATVLVLGKPAPHGDPSATLDVPLDDIAQVLAMGLAWTIRQRPELLAKADTSERISLEIAGKPAGPAVALTARNVEFAPISVFEQGGAKVTWNAQTNRATITYEKKTLELTPFHKDASIDGRQVDLGDAVLFTREGPTVPVLRVAELLGIKVDVIRTTTRLR